ncbi:bifunctional RNase H/acid phosphatase [Corynebacterium hindlerae]|uniref:bifunctional RNase H/acid phosphatase n=1 Tax=Corynebacterium hindlerae TaxID=699041 RepID=UPI001AD73F8C|nr:bifunctional RNase H/acid phosphatase [Corynebacterium hindlerae]QTH59154.1 bifunctional RNase H/acid phosphatase [Corynebacterium hindlerae]
MKLIIEADGGSRGNPGVAGSGIVVYSDSREVLREIAYVVGKASNNVAEYHGLLRGLEAAAELGATDVDVYMDSKLVVEQMSGRWKIKHPDMKELALQAQQLARGFDQVTYTWIPREKNKKADALSNVAMDACAEGKPVGVLDAEKPAEKPVEKPAEKNWHGASMRPTRFILIRHGQTEMSVAKQYSGSSNPPLTQTGVEQVEKVAQRLANRGGIDAIVCSPLTRARQSADIIAAQLGLPIREIDALRELDFGTWEGRTFAEVMEADPEAHAAFLSDTKASPPEGESVQAVARRVKKAIDALAEEYGEANIVLVSHVTPIKCVLKQALDVPASVVNKIHLDLASMSIAEFYADGPSIVRLVNG